MVERSPLLVLYSGDFEFIVMSDIDSWRNCHVMTCRNVNVKGRNQGVRRITSILSALSHECSSFALFLSLKRLTCEANIHCSLKQKTDWNPWHLNNINQKGSENNSGGRYRLPWSSIHQPIKSFYGSPVNLVYVWESEFSFDNLGQIDHERCVHGVLSSNVDRTEQY